VLGTPKQRKDATGYFAQLSENLAPLTRELHGEMHATDDQRSLHGEFHTTEKV
jgi:hypothetical protein